MADDRIEMRVLVAATTDAGSHAIGDVIVVDEKWAVMYELIHFAERVAATDLEPPHRKQKRIVAA